MSSAEFWGQLILRQERYPVPNDRSVSGLFLLHPVHSHVHRERTRYKRQYDGSRGLHLPERRPVLLVSSPDNQGYHPPYITCLFPPARAHGHIRVVSPVCSPLSGTRPECLISAAGASRPPMPPPK